MNYSIISKILISVGFAVVASYSLAATTSDYQEFFDSYVSLSDSFSPDIVNLYSDEAIVRISKEVGDGQTQIFELTGEKYKSIVLSALSTAEKVGDTSEFSNISIEISENRATIRAKRYARIKCHSDENYFMVVTEQSDGKLLITEESASSPMKSLCVDNGNYLSELLKASVEQTNKGLPTMIDSETQFVKTSSDGDTLTMHYRLVNYLSDEVDVDYFHESIGPLLLASFCTEQYFAVISQNKGTVSFKYSGSDEIEVLSFDFSEEDCED
jgi:hypothetical protein